MQWKHFGAPDEKESFVITYIITDFLIQLHGIVRRQAGTNPERATSTRVQTQGNSVLEKQSLFYYLQTQDENDLVFFFS